MSEFRGEALHMCPRIILKCQKVKRDDPEGWNGEGGGRRVQDGEVLEFL